ncbi:MAG: hypothetical protein AAB332_00540 [Planctomycetota bacterium]
MSLEEYGQDVPMAATQPTMVGQNTLRWVVEKQELLVMLNFQRN